MEHTYVVYDSQKHPVAKTNDQNAAANLSNSRDGHTYVRNTMMNQNELNRLPSVESLVLTQ